MSDVLYYRKPGNRAFEVTMLGITVGTMERLPSGKWYTEATLVRLDDPVIGAPMVWVGTFDSRQDATAAIERKVYQ